jgi:hypothetical protein
MKSSKGLLTIFLFFGLISNSYSQSYEIYGKIIDAETNEGIPYANIAIKDLYKGTASNLLGEFSFKVDSLPLVLEFSHLSYESKEMRISQSEELIISLTPAKRLMQELVIQGAGNESFAYDLVKKAYYHVMSRGLKERYGKAFYRQISKNGEDYSELYEIFYDTRYSNNGVEDWAIQEGRYALKLSTIDSFIYNKNFTQMVRLLTVVQPRTEDLVVPVSELVYEHFDLQTERIISANDRKLAVISFTKKDDVLSPALEGEISIDIDTYEVLKVEGVIDDDDLKFISLSGKRGSWKNYEIHVEFAFKSLDEDQLALDYMQLQQNFDYYQDDVFINEVETKSLFTYYEYYEPPRRKKLGGRLMRFSQRDADVLNRIGYNQLFWDENIIVKRTPIEAEVIESFERDRAFGSIYLNNLNQLILEDYEVDNDPFIIQVRNRLEQYDLPLKGEKVYIHHDRPFYLGGEDIWFSAYVVNMATNSPATASESLHLDILSPEGDLILSNIYPMEDGKAKGYVSIPDEINSGEYKLIAYTDWMKNFDAKLYFRKGILLLNRDDETGTYSKTLMDTVNRLKYHPEGGLLVNKMPAQIGYVGLDKFGETMDLRGRLLNSESRQLANMKTEYDGFGSIFVLPQTQVEYRTVVMSDEFEVERFPEINSEGYAIMVNNLKPNTIDITVRGTPNLEGKKFYILVISNGILFDRRIGMVTRGLYKTEIPKSNLPSGISQILLVNESGDIQNKRMVFVNQPDAATVKYYLAKKEYKPRERVDMVIEVNDQNGKSLGFSNISVSVVDRDKTSRQVNDPSIRSYLAFDYLLDYDLDSSGELFSDFDRESLKLFDYVMLNQRTIYPDIESFKETASKRLNEIRRKSGIGVTGKAYLQTINEPLKEGFLTFVTYTEDGTKGWWVRTDHQGNFSMDGISFTDSVQALVIAEDQHHQGADVAIELNGPGFRSETRESPTLEVELDNDVEKFFDEMRKETNSEVTSGVELSRTKDIKYGLFGEPFRSIEDFERYDQYSNLKQLLQSSLPGVAVRDGVPMVRGDDVSPLYFLDGVLINSAEELSNGRAASSMIPEKFVEIPIENIYAIDVYRGSGEKTIFGHTTQRGIIAIQLKRSISPLYNYESELRTVVWLPGYSASQEFYHPDYSDDDFTGPGTDSRTTLYWNPDITTNRKGRTKISFYNSDRARNMQICVEGMTQDGLPIFDVFDFGRNYSRRRNR